MSKQIWRKSFDLVGELHLIVSLRNRAEVWREADGDVVGVHLGHAAVLGEVGQQGEQVGDHLVTRVGMVETMMDSLFGDRRGGKFSLEMNAAMQQYIQGVPEKS